MNCKETGSSRVALMATLTVIGGLILVFFPALVSGVWKVLAWGATAAGAGAAGTFHHMEKQKKILAEKEVLRKRSIRRKEMDKERVEQEKRLEASKEKMAQKEVRKAEKRAKIKEGLVKEAETTWVSRVDYADEQEALMRQIIEKTNRMPVRTAAGQVVIEWNEASTLAQWTMKQIMMYTQRPDVTHEAREEAQEATLEAMRIKDSGGLWTKEHGEQLAEKKEKARLEALIEEERLDAVKNAIESAELKWKATENRAARWQGELDIIIAQNKNI